MDLLRPIVLCTLTNNFTFTAKHVRGIDNGIADSLSRFQMDRFKQLAPLASPLPCVIPSSRHPVINDSNLRDRVYQLIQHSWATSTKQTYAAGIKRFISFCLEKGIVTPCSPLLPATEITLLCWTFISYTYATVKRYLASVSYLHVIFQVLFNMGTMQLLEKCLKGLKCLKGEKTRDRRPITFKEIACLHRALRPKFTDSIDNVMLWAAFTLAFFGFLRCSEFTCNSPFDPEYHLSRTGALFSTRTF